MTEKIAVVDDRVHVGERLVITFQRTLRVPDDGRDYPLPPGLGRFPVVRAKDHAAQLPASWRGDLLVPMYRREALWIAFEGTSWKPNAVKVGIGGVDAISGDAWDGELRDDPQNYIVAPDQPWLDGINSGAGKVRQFVAMPLGEGVSVEAQITGDERTGGIQITAFEPLPGLFPDVAPEPEPRDDFAPMAAPAMLGVGAGGSISQKIYPDKYGIETWDREHPMSFFVRLIDAAELASITGMPKPSSPVDAAAYTAAGLPWFALYDDREDDIQAASALAKVRSIRELEQRTPEDGIDVPKRQVKGIGRRK